MFRINYALQLHASSTKVDRTFCTCKTDFRNISALEPCSKNLSIICFTLVKPISTPSFKHSDDRGMRITVESKDDIFSPISMALNWSRNRSVKLVPASRSRKTEVLFNTASIIHEKIEFIPKKKKKNDGSNINPQEAKKNSWNLRNKLQIY